MDKISLHEIFRKAKEKSTGEKNTCVGRLFRCKKNTFINKRGEYVEDMRMSPLKRKSCKGCSYCDYLEDDLHEFIDSGTPVIIDSPENGAIYQLKMVNLSTDYETGYVDDWDLEFIKVQEKE